MGLLVRGKPVTKPSGCTAKGSLAAQHKLHTAVNFHMLLLVLHDV